MKDEIRREDTRSLESYVERLERLMAQPKERQHKIGNTTSNNVAGFNTKHLPNFSTSSIINPRLWKTDKSGSQENE